MRRADIDVMIELCSGRTLQAIANDHKVSRQRIHQIVVGMLATLGATHDPIPVVRCKLHTVIMRREGPRWEYDTPEGFYHNERGLSDLDTVRRVYGIRWRE